MAWAGLTTPGARGCRGTPSAPSDPRMLRLGGHGHPEPADNRDIFTNEASPLTAEVGGWPGGSVAVTVNDVLDGHVVLDECLDRIYLNGYVPNLQVEG